MSPIGYTLFAAEMVMQPGDEFFKSEGYFDAGYKATNPFDCAVRPLNLFFLSISAGLHRPG